jgi:SAM-dependent methyltransferase
MAGPADAWSQRPTMLLKRGQMDHHRRPGTTGADHTLVVAGNADLVSSENFHATLLDVDEYRRFLAASNAPADTFALVRRRAPTAPTGWAWDLYTERGNRGNDQRVHVCLHRVPRSRPPVSTASTAAARTPDDPPVGHRAPARSREAASAPRCQDGFARWAEQYEQDVLSQLLTKLQFRAAARLRLAATDRFLDVGCATGAAVRDASVTVELAVGVDRSAAMVRRARLLARALPGAVFVVADGERLPFPAGSFTAVLSSSTLRHFRNPTRAVREMARVVRPGGRIVIADFMACGDGDDRHWWNSLRPPRQVPRWIGPLQALASAPVPVTEVVRCSTAFGYYAIVSATKPKAPTS